ncbi:pyruvate formate lyase family protein [Candidatus Latescibacterota bacterium]
MTATTDLAGPVDTERVADLRRRVRDAMDTNAIAWDGPAHIDADAMAEPLQVRKARAIALKLGAMPTDLWEGQLFAGSMTFESPRLHAEWGFPGHTTEVEQQAAAERGLSTRSVFGHIVPDYPRLLDQGLVGIGQEARAQRPGAATGEERAFLDAVEVALDGVVAYARRLSLRCELEAQRQLDPDRAAELRQMAANLRQVPAGPAETFWQALQSVWLLHLVFHATMNGNAMGRLDQYAWPFLERDLEAGELTLDRAAELVDCFCLKFNERAQTSEEQRPELREPEPLDLARRTRHATSSQVGSRRDRVDATNHWLQNIIVGGLTSEGADVTNPLTFLILDSYRRNQMTNPLVTVRLHRNSPGELLCAVCEALKEGGGMPALFNDEALVPALEALGFPGADARDYTNDGCWEVIIPGRTDFRFQRLSLMLCLERALGRGCNRLDQTADGPDTGDPRRFTSFDQVWEAFVTQVDAMVAATVARVVDTIDERSTIAPVPLLSALIDGAIAARRDLTAGGARFRTFGMLAESAAHAIDSLTAIRSVVFEEQTTTMAELCDALEIDFEGCEALRGRLAGAPKYGNDDDRADEVGRRVMAAFTESVERHAAAHRSTIAFPCGAATFSWYVGIGEGLGPSPDGRLSGQPVSSNLSPALGRDLEGICAAILSHAKMGHDRLPAGGPLDLRLARHLVRGHEGTERMVGLIRGFVEAGGSMMTLTVADTEELRAAQRQPEDYRSLRVRMGGWCAYFTMLSRQQQDHHIRRQEARS